MVCGSGDLGGISGDLGAGSPLIVISGMGERGGSRGNLKARSIVPVRRDFFREPSSSVRREVGRSRDELSSFSSSSSPSSSSSFCLGGVVGVFLESEGGGEVGSDGAREGGTGRDWGWGRVNAVVDKEAEGVAPR